MNQPVDNGAPREAYHRRIAQHGLTPLWALVPERPRLTFVAHLWRYDEIRLATLVATWHPSRRTTKLERRSCRVTTCSAGC